MAFSQPALTDEGIAPTEDDSFELPAITLHGFVSQGAFVSTDNNYLGQSERGSFEFLEAAHQRLDRGDRSPARRRAALHPRPRPDRQLHAHARLGLSRLPLARLARPARRAHQDAVRPLQRVHRHRRGPPADPAAAERVPDPQPRHPARPDRLRALREPRRSEAPGALDYHALRRDDVRRPELERARRPRSRELDAVDTSTSPAASCSGGPRSTGCASARASCTATSPSTSARRADTHAAGHGGPGAGRLRRHLRVRLPRHQPGRRLGRVHARDDWLFGAEYSRWHMHVYSSIPDRVPADRRATASGSTAWRPIASPRGSRLGAYYSVYFADVDDRDGSGARFTEPHRATSRTSR